MKRFRMDDWLIGAVILGTLIAIIAPQQIGVTLYKLSLLAIAGAGGYWLDRRLFPYGRPDRLDGYFSAWAQIRRALIVSACIIGVSLGA